MNIRSKVILLMMLLILFICAVFFSMLYQKNQQGLQQMIEAKIEVSNFVADSVLTHISEQYQLRIKSFINYKVSKTRKQIIKAFAARNRDELFRLSKPFLDIFKNENPYFATMSWILPNNRVFLRVHKPQNSGDDISKERLIIDAVNRDQIQYSGFSAGHNGPELRIVQPVFYAGEYLGAVQMGIDARIVIETLQQKVNLPAGFSIPNDKFNDRLTEEGLGALVDSAHTLYSTNNDLFKGLIGEVDWNNQQQKIKLNGHLYVLHQVLPLNNFRGERFGDFFVAIDISEVTAATQKAIVTVILLSFLILFLSYVVLYFGFGSLVEKIVGLNKSLEKANQELESRVEERTRKLVQETEERKVVEERLHKAEKMEVIGLMASGIAHDLNNILSGVINYPELLLMRLPENSKLRQPIISIKKAGLRAAAVVMDLLTVARDAAKVRTPANINLLVLEYLRSPEAETLRSRYPEVVITTDLDPDLPDISCSPTHINKSLMNLVLNAVEAFTGVGTVTIRSRRLKLPDASIKEEILPFGDYIALQVEDNGPGISQEALAHIFEPFYTNKKMGRSGTGIGLTVVWNCMQDHDGSVNVQSDEQQGTLFTLLFPVTHEDKSQPQLSQTVPALRGHGETILVVDDEPCQRDIAMQFLSELGYQVQSVSSGEDAIAYVKKNKVDLLLLDMLMEPGLDGCETFTEIIKTDPEQKAIIVSGYSGSEQMKKVLELGAGDYLKKPYTLEQLGAVVGEILYQK